MNEKLSIATAAGRHSSGVEEQEGDLGADGEKMLRNHKDGGDGG